MSFIKLSDMTSIKLKYVFSIIINGKIWINKNGKLYISAFIYITYKVNNEIILDKKYIKPQRAYQGVYRDCLKYLGISTEEIKTVEFDYICEEVSKKSDLSFYGY